MHPLLIQALGNIAIDIYKRATAPSDNAPSDGPQSWQEAFAMVGEYAERKDKTDEEQSQLIVQIAEKVDAVANEHRALADAHRALAWSTTLSRLVGIGGGLCGVAALVIVLLRI